MLHVEPRMMVKSTYDIPNPRLFLSLLGVQDLLQGAKAGLALHHHALMPWHGAGLRQSSWGRETSTYLAYVLNIYGNQRKWKLVRSQLPSNEKLNLFYPFWGLRYCNTIRQNQAKHFWKLPGPGTSRMTSVSMYKIGSIYLKYTSIDTIFYGIYKIAYRCIDKYSLQHCLYIYMLDTYILNISITYINIDTIYSALYRMGPKNS